MFLQASVILSTGGRVSASVHAGLPPPPQEQTPPWDQTSLGVGNPGADTPPGPDPTPLPGSRRQHTVNERPVRILLECILVLYFIYYRWHI